MNKLTLYPLTVLLLAVSLFAADPVAGTWKLNLAKSTFGGPMQPRQELTIVFQKQGDQGVETVKGVAADGSPISYKVTFSKTGGEGKFLEGVAPPSTGILAKRKPDSRIRDWKFMRDGKVVATEHDAVSEDGKTLRMTIKGTDAQGKPYETVEVFDRI
jgi:hypothetical protein